MSSTIRLSQLNLENFGKHVSLQVEFSDMLTVIKGPNGSGKTTILQAYYFAHFGSSAVDGKAEDLPYTGEKDCRVWVHEYIGGELYVIERTMKTAKVIKCSDPSKALATGHTAVNEWVEKAFGVSQRVFKELTYSEQTETAALMSLGATALNRMIEVISEADFIFEVETESTNIARTANTKLAVIETPKDVGELRVQLTAAQANKAGSGARLKIAADNRGVAQARSNTLSDNVKAVKLAHTQRVKLTDELSMAHEKVIRHKATLDESLRQLSEITETKEMLDDAVSERDIIQRTIKTESVKLVQQTEITSAIRTLKTWFSTADEMLENFKMLSPKLEDARVRLASIVSEISGVQVTANAADTALFEANEAVLNAICVTCKRPLNDDGLQAATVRAEECKELAKSTHARLTELMGKRTAIKTEFDKLYKDCPAETFPAHHAEKKAMLENLEKTDFSVFITKEDMQALTEKSQTLASRVGEIRGALSRREETEIRASRADKLHAEAVIAVDEVKGKLEEIGEVDLIGAQEKFSEAYREYQEAETIHDKAANEDKSNELNVRAFNTEIERSENLMVMRAAQERRQVAFTGLSKYLRTNRSTFMLNMWEGLLAQTSDFVSQVTDGRIERIERDEDGRFYYIEGGQRRAYAKLAGGLKAVAGVGLRIALASLLPAGVSLVVLDEPSSELADDLAAALAGALRGTDRQIVLVTHRQGEEYSSDRVIELTV